MPFPYTDRLAEKRRPALVVTGDRLAAAGYVWVVMITTAKRGARPHDVPIRDFAAAGLPAPCLIRPTKLACIEPSRILRQAGEVDAATASEVAAVARSFIEEAVPSRTVRGRRRTSRS